MKAHKEASRQARAILRLNPSGRLTATDQRHHEAVVAYILKHGYEAAVKMYNPGLLAAQKQEELAQARTADRKSAGEPTPRGKQVGAPSQTPSQGARPHQKPAPVESHSVPAMEPFKMSEQQIAKMAMETVEAARIANQTELEKIRGANMDKLLALAGRGIPMNLIAGAMGMQSDMAAGGELQVEAAKAASGAAKRAAEGTDGSPSKRRSAAKGTPKTAGKAAKKVQSLPSGLRLELGSEEYDE